MNRACLALMLALLAGLASGAAGDGCDSAGNGASSQGSSTAAISSARIRPGTWLNVNPSTPDIAEIIVQDISMAEVGRVPTQSVHVYGACLPDCDWTTAPTFLNASNTLIAYYDFGFVASVLKFGVDSDPSRLTVNMQSNFTDGRGTQLVTNEFYFSSLDAVPPSQSDPLPGPRGVIPPPSVLDSP